MSLRDSIVGIMYGFPMGLAATAGLFHILVHTGSLASELMMGIYQLSVVLFFLAAFIVNVAWDKKP